MLTNIVKIIKITKYVSEAQESGSMAQRKDYIVSTSFRTYLTATILTMVIEQLCLIFDGIIMSHLFGGSL